MVVNITNITDGPGRNPVQVDIYNKTLAPGSSVKIPADLVTKRLRDLEAQGTIAIGRLPPWYVSAKSRRGRALTPEEKASRTVIPSSSSAPVVEKVEKKPTPTTHVEVKKADLSAEDVSDEAADRKRNKR